MSSNSLKLNKMPQGSAKSGAHHWLAQRLTALILIPLTVWFVASLIAMPFHNYEHVIAWMSGTFNAAGLLIMIVAALYHAALGLQVVYEDYIHRESFKTAMVLLTKFVFLFLGVIAVLSIAKIHLLIV